MKLKQGIKAQDVLEFKQNNTLLVEPFNTAVQGLDNNLTPMQVEDLLYNYTLSAYQAGVIAQAINKLHKRGDEFRIYWNKRFAVPENEKDDVDPKKLILGRAYQARVNGKGPRVEKADIK